MHFKFIKFDPQRAARNATAALVEYDVDGNVDWMWMCQSDIRERLRLYGPSAELDKALEAYKKGGQ